MEIQNMNKNERAGSYLLLHKESKDEQIQGVEGKLRAFHGFFHLVFLLRFAIKIPEAM